MSVGECRCSFTDTSILGPKTCSTNFTLFLSLIEYLLQHQCNIAEPCNRSGHDDFLVSDMAQYDYIVVGAGVAGPVVASRLAAANSTAQTPPSVLLLEAGPEEPTASQVPAFAFSAVDSEVDWKYKTVTQKGACLSRAGVCSWPRGKMVSGTSGMHGMMYYRGHASIYDNWKAQGNTGWGYKDVLQYFIKSENNQDRPRRGEKQYHGYKGPLTVGRFPHKPPLASEVIAAGIELGYRHGDLNGKNQTGFEVAPMMLDKGLRGSTTRLYLRKLGKNVDVLINSHVTRVLIGSDGRATGVEYVDGKGVKKRVLAKKEVILSAGAIGSPQILLLSGIGPRDDLQKLGIPVKQDLPVGRNLMNHVGTSLLFTINDTSHRVLNYDTLLEYVVNRRGPMASTGLTQTTGFLLSKYATNDTPDIQIFFDGFSATCSNTGFKNECTDGHLGNCGRRVIDARPIVVMPQSKGFLKLKTSNPMDYPLLDPKYFEQSIDADILVDAIKKVIALTETTVLKKWDFQIDKSHTKGCKGLKFGSDKYWHCHVRQNTEPENHQGGTCKMGPVGDPESVVDPQLRVHGIPNLRVVDASIFPYVPNANPSAPIIMAAEKCADMIIANWVTAD